MVGYEPGRDEYPRQLFGISGAFSGMVTRACLQPLDVLKIRFQVDTNIATKINRNVEQEKLV